MRRRAFVVATSAVILASAWPSGTAPADPADGRRGRRGKVVRVERPKALATDDIQLCGIDTSVSDSSDAPKLMCFGEAPRIGATIEFVDDGGYRGSGRVVRVEPGLPMFSRCTEKAGHTVYFEWSSGSGVDAAGGYGSNIAGVIGVKMNPNGAKLLNAPDRRPPEGDASAYAIGLDADGDTHADLVVLVRECRDTTRVPGGAGGSQYQAIFCLDYWIYQRSEWKLVNQATVYNCL